MAVVSHRERRVSPLLVAALLLAARTFLRTLGLDRPSEAEVLAATGAGRSRAYELRNELLEWLPALLRPVGRPAREPTAPPASRTADLGAEVLRFVMEHPGCVWGDQRRSYSDAFRNHILELRERYDDLDLLAFAGAVQVPCGTLEDWLGPNRSLQPSSEPLVVHPDNSRAVGLHVQTLLDAWQRWHGPWKAFCQHVQRHLRVPLGRDRIATILDACGARPLERRPGRSPDEAALRNAFTTFFPGAQWVGDGMELPVFVDGRRFTFNVELDVDAFSAAIVGGSLRDEEDGQAVTEAFEDGVETTGQPPIAVLLDNRPSNHTDEVEDALGDAIKIRATTGRGQNKGHVEGAFGLFRQTAPNLALNIDDPRELARQLAWYAVVVWARTLNYRPRKTRGGRSRVDIYRDTPVTDEQVDRAREQLRQRQRRQQRARQTRQARQDPLVRAVLDEAFERLALDDPDHNLRDAIARYSLDTVIDAIATFEGMRQLQPQTAPRDARYLLGIARNIEHVHEAIPITEALIRERRAVRDRLLAQLDAQRNHIAAIASDPDAQLRELLDQALGTDRLLDRLVWLHAAADLIRQQPQHRHELLANTAARRIHACFRISRADRHLAARLILRRLWPID